MAPGTSGAAPGDFRGQASMYSTGLKNNRRPPRPTLQEQAAQNHAAAKRRAALDPDWKPPRPTPLAELQASMQADVARKAALGVWPEFQSMLDPREAGIWQDQVSRAASRPDSNWILSVKYDKEREKIAYSDKQLGLAHANSRSYSHAMLTQGAEMVVRSLAKMRTPFYNPNETEKEQCECSNCWENPQQCQFPMKGEKPTKATCWRQSFFWHLQRHGKMLQVVENDTLGPGQIEEARMAHRLGIPVKTLHITTEITELVEAHHFGPNGGPVGGSGGAHHHALISMQAGLQEQVDRKLRELELARPDSMIAWAALQDRYQFDTCTLAEYKMR